MGNANPAQGWSTYPKNLEGLKCASWDYDYGAYHDDFVADSRRLFGESGQIRVRVLEIGHNEHEFDSVEGLEQYLKRLGEEKLTRIFLIPQQCSWGQLIITYEAICKLFTYLNVFPAVIDMLRAFGEKTGYEDDSYSEFVFQESENTTETLYLIKHVERHGREERDDPWSIRQMGIYHKSDQVIGDVFVIFNPARSFQRRLKIVKTQNILPQVEDIHLALLTSVTANWRWYITDLERTYESIKAKSQLSTIVNISERKTAASDICYDDIQDIQVLQDYCLKLCLFLEMNLTVFHEVRARHIWKRVDAHGTQIQHGIGTEMQRSRAITLLKRLNGTLELVRSILDFRCSASLQNNSITMTNMAHLAKEENALIIKLTEKASRDADILKTLTILALFFLPASFVASMMSMGYIRVDNTKRQTYFRVDSEFWVFLVLTLILLAVTFGSYFWWQLKRRSGKAQRAHQNEDIDQ